MNGKMGEGQEAILTDDMAMIRDSDNTHEHANSRRTVGTVSTKFREKSKR